MHSLDWCKSAAPGQQLWPRSAYRIGIASFTENYNNRIAVIGLQDERVLVEDDYTDQYPDFATLCEAPHGLSGHQSAVAASFSDGSFMDTEIANNGVTRDYG